MLNIIKESALQVLGMPLGFESRIKEFSTHTVIVIKGTRLNGRAYVLPGNRYLQYGKDSSMHFFGMKAISRKILVVQDLTIEDSISDEDMSYFSDLNNFYFRCNMKMRDLSIGELFLPINTIVSEKPVSKNGKVLEYKTSISSYSVFVREGSNRAKFIDGKTDFFSDPLDFYTAKNAIVSPDRLEHSALVREIGVEELLNNLLEDKTVSTMISLLSDANMRDFVENTLRMRKVAPSKISDDVYWEECIDSDRGVSNFSSLNWDNIEQSLLEAKNTPESYLDITTHIVVETSVSGWHPFTTAVFWNLYLLLSDEKIQFIEDTFNLNKGD